MKTSFIGVSLLACTTLAGCNSTNVGTAVMQQATLAMAATDGANKPLLEALQADNRSLARTVATDLPPSGSATYTGFAQVISDRSVIPTSSTELVGRATLEVGFAGAGSMSGTVDDFDDAGTEYGGALTVSNGSISSDANGPLVRGDINGTLTNGGTSYDVNGNISGSFFGPNGEYLNGFDDITVSSGANSSATGISLNAERQ
jgi:hypothetical protein